MNGAMQSAVYYTFSTIPQVLAGAIALLGAFTLYRLRGLGEQEDNVCGLLREDYRHTEIHRQTFVNPRINESSSGPLTGS